MSNTVCCFHFSIVNQGKNISEAPKELEHQPCRKFESCMIGKTGGWYLLKNLVLFWPPDMQKTQEIPGFFGQCRYLNDIVARVVSFYSLFMQRQRNVTICALVQVCFGLNVVSLVPTVTPFFAAHRIAL
jgi:hypothetical protein